MKSHEIALKISLKSHEIALKNARKSHTRGNCPFDSNFRRLKSDPGFIASQVSPTIYISARKNQFLGD
jgi:hypothetical protein